MYACVLVGVREVVSHTGFAPARAGWVGAHLQSHDDLALLVPGLVHIAKLSSSCAPMSRKL